MLLNAFSLCSYTLIKKIYLGKVVDVALKEKSPYCQGTEATFCSSSRAAGNRLSRWLEWLWIAHTAFGATIFPSHCQIIVRFSRLTEVFYLTQLYL